MGHIVCDILQIPQTTAVNTTSIKQLTSSYNWTGTESGKQAGHLIYLNLCLKNRVPVNIDRICIEFFSINVLKSFTRHIPQSNCKALEGNLQ